MIEVDGLTKRYGSLRALDDVSFAIGKGEVVGFVGPNGAGKSTAMKCITGFLSADAGTVRVGDVDVREHPLEARRRIGYLPETNPLYDEMRVDDYLAFIGGIRGLRGAEVNEAIGRAVESAGLEGRLAQVIRTLSKGFRQRVGLAQALLHDPDLLILDEPHSGLDPNQIVEFRGLLRRLGETKTILYSTHFLTEVAVTCSRVMVIDEGRMTADGPLGDVMGEGTLEKAFAALTRNGRKRS